MPDLFTLRIFAKKICLKEIAEDIYFFFRRSLVGSVSLLNVKPGFEPPARIKTKYKKYFFLVLLLGCWLLRCKAGVRIPGQTSYKNTKSISLTVFSQQIYGKNSEREINLP